MKLQKSDEKAMRGSVFEVLSVGWNSGFGWRADFGFQNPAHHTHPGHFRALRRSGDTVKPEILSFRALADANKLALNPVLAVKEQRAVDMTDLNGTEQADMVTERALE